MKTPTVLSVLVALIVIAGCSKSPRPQTTAKPPEPAVAQPTQPPLVEPDAQRAEATPAQPEVKPDAVAQRAEQYSREIDSLMKQREAQRPAPPPTPAQQVPAQPEPSRVQWIDPAEFRLGETQSQPRTAVTDSRKSPQPVVPEPAPPKKPAEPDSAVAAAANMPVSVAEPDNKPATTPPPVSGSTDPLGAKLSGRIREYPRDVSFHLEYQLLQMLLDEQVPQLAALASLPNEDRELISAVIDGMSLFRSTLRSDNNMLLSSKIRPLVDMADRLRSQADMTIPTVELCRSVGGFGKYEPLEPAQFAAGKEHQAIVYTEVANFMSNLNDDRMWETKLRQELVLYTESGQPIWDDKIDLPSDISRNRRHDFFVARKVTIPGNLSMGRYILKVSIVDTQANRVAEDSIPLVVAAN